MARSELGDMIARVLGSLPISEDRLGAEITDAEELRRLLVADRALWGSAPGEVDFMRVLAWHEGARQLGAMLGVEWPVVARELRREAEALRGSQRRSPAKRGRR